MSTDDDGRKIIIHLTNDDAGTGNLGMRSLCLLPVDHLKVFRNFDIKEKLNIVNSRRA